MQVRTDDERKEREQYHMRELNNRRMMTIIDCSSLSTKDRLAIMWDLSKGQEHLRFDSGVLADDKPISAMFLTQPDRVVICTESARTFVFTA